MSNGTQRDIDVARVAAAKREARELRALFDRLTPIERMLAAKQIEAVRRLVEAVESL
ncbi:TPA: hypothetical protein QDB40_000237 [Burkholderia vietnamiensis]|uniref:MarR family transcriptional regulator n=1 Tax=Burkholderia vietnamiensis TaxID=60552 RepID=A0ABS1APJ0_BURVI|nr:hypothetical protein [Burkholderia vietnamiensis]MBJ9686059.1 hypothetical protein [Burkholderia vietnamiensis]UKV73143.1 hypothetical protein FOC29_04920 [Burkholderia vietnamiensis]HDR8925172.1 hypothetical protein [Burkholderia vietnamiensis]HDR9098391.1 hypothetical protein [Burkholderia vietnamiensis]HDR9166335.1 hypothetical protein [Burkholderia vietnamiensis]